MKKNKRINNFALFLVFTGICLVFLPLIFTSFEIKDLHLLGDYTGGVVGSCWALSGTLFIYSSLLNQQEESKQQLLTISEQNFSTTFFNMLNYYSKMLSEIDTKHSLKSDKRDGFKILLDDFNRLKDFNDTSRNILEAPILFLNEIYISINKNYQINVELIGDDTFQKNIISPKKESYYRILKASMNMNQLEVMKFAIKFGNYSINDNLIDLFK